MLSPRDVGPMLAWMTQQGHGVALDGLRASRDPWLCVWHHLASPVTGLGQVPEAAVQACLETAGYDVATVLAQISKEA